MTYQPFPPFVDWNVQFDTSVIDAYAERLRQAKASATEEAQRRALEIATRYAAVDTGALEGLFSTDRGFTRTIATQSDFWHRALDLKGEQAKRSIEDALAAYDYVLDAVTGSTPVTQKWIKELHAVITEHQESFTVILSIADQLYQAQRPLPHGECKRLPNNPISRSTGKVHYYASPEDTASEMDRLIEELRSDGFSRAHPVLQAAYAHYAYVHIHPFTDGNGRVARALASVYLYRNPGVPLVIFADQRDIYIDALEAADGGHPSAFVHFISERVIDTVNLIAQSMRVAINTADAVSEINAALGAAPDKDLALAAGRLHQLCYSHLEAEIQSLALAGRVKIWPSVGGVSGSAILPKGYVLPGLGNDGLYLSAQEMDRAVSLATDHCYLAVTAEEGRPELLVISDNSPIPFEVWRRELNPTLSASLEARLVIWAKEVVGRFVTEVCHALKRTPR
ncbi:MAG: Fic family protein [Propionibacteriaceae bacterium]|jgi:Fic family protein|nr:Fic family protein [Propionibacteriaceae bacterium]